MSTPLSDIISPDQLDNLRHTLGLNYQPTPYRNHYVADKGGDAIAGLMDMVEKGLMTSRPEPFGGTGTCFHATEAGKTYAMDRQPAPKKKTRYEEFLSADTGLSFSEFLGIDKPVTEKGSGSTAGSMRIVSSRAKGEWATNMTLAKASYKAELAKNKPARKNPSSQLISEFCQEP